MNYQFFVIPAQNPSIATDELNAFCNRHRITEIEKQFVANGANSFWSICVTWIEQEGSLVVDSTQRHKNKIDYKDILSDDEFTLYSRLRTLRKSIAEREGTPAYNIFTNAQLAAIVQQRIATKSALLELEGIGKMRVEKYANELLDYIKDMHLMNKPDETSSDHA